MKKTAESSPFSSGSNNPEHHATAKLWNLLSNLAVSPKTSAVKAAASSMHLQTVARHPSRKADRTSSEETTKKKLWQRRESRVTANASPSLTDGRGEEREEGREN